MVVTKSKDFSLTRNCRAQANSSTWRIGAGIAVNEIDAVANRIQRQAVADTENIDLHTSAVLPGEHAIAKNLHAARRIDCSHVGQRQHLIAVAQIRVLVGNARPMLAGALGAGVVQRQVDALRLLFLDLDPGVDLAFVFADAESHFDLFCRVLVAELNVFGQRAHVRRRAFLQVGQSGTHIRVIEMFVAGDDDLADDGFADLQAHHTGGELLLRHIDLNGAITQTAKLAFESFQRLLHVAIILAAAYEWRYQLLGSIRRKYGIAFDLKARDVECCILCPRVIQRCCRDKSGNSQGPGHRIPHKQSPIQSTTNKFIFKAVSHSLPIACQINTH